MGNVLKRRGGQEPQPGAPPEGSPWLTHPKLWGAAEAGDSTTLSKMLRDNHNYTPEILNAVDEHGNTLLRWASLPPGCAQCVRILLEAGADPNGRQILYFTPLTHAFTPHAPHIPRHTHSDE